MAAINALYMTVLEAGAHVVATASLYGPSRTILEKEYSRFGVEATFVDSSDPENVERRSGRRRRSSTWRLRRTPP
jgi:methionine-gamma-lyase